jgi:(S)-mandelate dehydrogenase
MHRTSKALNISDLRDMARRRLPKALFEYLEGGCEDDVALDANRAALQRLKLTPRVLTDTSARATRTTLFGKPLEMPFAIAPTAIAGLAWFDGEIALARAAGQAGIPFTAATSSLTSIERLAAAATGRLWLQLYLWNQRELAYGLIDRAAAVGVDALIFTVDTPVDPNREYNRRNGFGIPIQPSFRMAADVATHPSWLFGVLLRTILTNGVPRFENYPESFRLPITSRRIPSDLTQQDRINWDDLSELRRRWKGTLIVKGIIAPEDAEAAVKLGADGIVVSNHGGRNFDSSPASIDALPAIVDAVGSQTTVLFDSGVRRGSDIAKALALGARAVLVGRAPLYGAAIGGEEGALRALEILRDELKRVMAATGCRAIADLGRHLLRP